MTEMSMIKKTQCLQTSIEEFMINIDSTGIITQDNKAELRSTLNTLESYVKKDPCKYFDIYGTVGEDLIKDAYAALGAQSPWEKYAAEVEVPGSDINKINETLANVDNILGHYNYFKIKENAAPEFREEIAEMYESAEGLLGQCQEKLDQILKEDPEKFIGVYGYECQEKIDIIADSIERNKQTLKETSSIKDKMDRFQPDTQKVINNNSRQDISI